MKLFLRRILKIMVKIILAKYKPEIIGITGSVGKTGAKEAIYTVLAAKFKARQNLKNYNNEIGLPLTVIGVKSPLNSYIGWFKVIITAIKISFKIDKNYPEMLILEMAADKPGDINYLTNMVKCNISVITAISDSHIESFKTSENIVKEKATLIRKLDKTGWAVLNIDDNKIKTIIKETKARIFTYSIDGKADLIAQEIRIKLPLSGTSKDQYGVSFKLIHKGSFAPVFLPGVISRAGVYAALAGAAVGVIKGLNLVEISQALQKYESPNGRMKLIDGIKNTFIIDDTYNSSPTSSVLALDTLGKIIIAEAKYKYAVFGDMLELGSFSQSGHEEVGVQVVKNKINKLIVVGEKSRDIARGAQSAGMKVDDIFHFAKPEEAGKFIQERIKTGDIILVKGSQGSRMEKVVKEIMAEPWRSEDLLVRQGKEWLE